MLRCSLSVKEFAFFLIIIILFLALACILWISFVSEVEQLILANHLSGHFLSSAHACALKCCDLAKKAFINRLCRPLAILSVALSPGKEKMPGPKFSNPDHFFQKNWSGGPKFSMKKIGPGPKFLADQHFCDRYCRSL